jgi:glycosyltransferase involved in cell wall biosynthesis
MSILLAGQPVADETRVPHVVHVREIFHGTGGRIGNALWPLYRRQLERADALICVSAATARQFNGSSTTSVLYDGVARSLVLPPRGGARAELGLPENAFVVAVTGRISDWKGQQVVVRALAHEALAGIGAIGLFAGDAAPGQEHYELELSRLAHELGVEDRLRLVGFRNDVATVLAAADAVAVPSIYEDPLPQSALEAASLGLPVVASKRGGLPEIIRDGITGRLVAAGDHAALALALRQLADDPSRAQELATAGAADIAARFSSKRMVEQVEQCYERLIR